MCIAAGDHEVISLAGEAVHKKFPLREILDFVKEQDFGFIVHRIDCCNDLIIIQKIREPLVIEIDIAKRSVAAPGKVVDGEERLSGPARAGDHLDERRAGPGNPRIPLDICLGQCSLEVTLLDKKSVADSHNHHI